MGARSSVDALRRVLGGPPRGSGEEGTGRGVALPGALTTSVDVVDLAVRALLVLVLLGEFGLVLVEIVRRATFDLSFLWNEEVSRLALLSLTFLGGALAYRARMNTALDTVTSSLRPAARTAVEACLDQTVALVGLVCCGASLDLFGIDAESVMPVTEMSQGWTVVPFTAGLGLVVLFALERLPSYGARANAWASCASAAAGLVVYLGLTTPAVHLEGGAALAATLVVFFATILLGLPVAFAMLAGSILFLALSDAAPLVAVAQNTVDGSGHFILLTLPFFIWAGMIMEEGAISLRLVRFAMALVGHLRGGLLQVVVLTTYLVSGVSGSKIADVVAVGSVMREELRRKDYRLEDGTAVLAASAAMSETIPPSIAMLVLGSVVPVSIGRLFVAGLLPAGVLAALLMLTTYVMSRRRGVAPLPRARGRQVARDGAGALLPLLMPVILIAGIKFGVATPTEVSSVAVLYGLVLTMGLYRTIGLAALVRIASRCAVMSGMVLFVIAASSSFAWILVAGDLPAHLVSLLEAAGHSRPVFLAGSVVVVMVVGSLLEGLPALIILAPTLYPIAGQFGVDGIQYGILLLLAMGVGIFMPPIGIGFHISCSIMRVGVEPAGRAMLPYFVVLLVGIALIATFPWITDVASLASD